MLIDVAERRKAGVPQLVGYSFGQRVYGRLKIPSDSLNKMRAGSPERPSSTTVAVLRIHYSARYN